jgi:hypothetical protein
LHRQTLATGDSISVSGVFDQLPVALLEAEIPATVMRRLRGDSLAG